MAEQSTRSRSKGSRKSSSGGGGGGGGRSRSRGAAGRRTANSRKSANEGFAQPQIMMDRRREEDLQSQSRMRQMGDQAMETMRQHPLPSILIGSAMGLLIVQAARRSGATA